MSAEAPERSVKRPVVKSGAKFPRTSRLLKHCDFERVYKQGRRLFSKNTTVFYLQREDGAGSGNAGPRIGFTVGRVLGGAVERNRIKRRLREAIRMRRSALQLPVDVVINPKKSVLTTEFEVLLDELGRALDSIAKKVREK